MEVMVRMGRLDAAHIAFSHALCRVGQPVAMLDSSGAILFANPALEDLVVTTPSLEFHAGQLHCTRQSADQDLQRFIRALVTSNKQVDEERSLAIENGSASQKLSFVGLPIHSDFAKNLDLGGASAIIFVSHLAPMRTDLAATFSEFFELSHQQSEVVRNIANGLDGPAIADRLSISPNTLKTHMNRIYDKTGTRSREDLFRQLISLAAQTPILNS